MHQMQIWTEQLTISYAVDAEEIWRKLVHCWTNYMIMEMNAKKFSVKTWLFWKLKAKQGFLLKFISD